MTFTNTAANEASAPVPALPGPAPTPAAPPERTAPATVDETLVTILSWKRPHESKSEIEFCSWLHGEIERRGASFEIKAMGCTVVTIMTESKLVLPTEGPQTRAALPTTMFSCHVDTVHSEGVGKQRLTYDPGFGHIFLDKKDANAGSCLGADDGAGVWLMLEMIAAKVPGTYVFHRGEERGGIGSRAMLAAHKEWLEGFDLAVAFDRADNDEVITHQGGLCCASDKFGKALISELAAHGLEYKLSTGGVFTDTKVYRGVVSECINLGVGYKWQHSKDEYLDYTHLVALRDACIKIDWHRLPADRDPKAADPAPRYSGYGGYGAQSALDWDNDDHYEGARWRGAKPQKKAPKGGGKVHQFPRPPSPPTSVREPDVSEEIGNMSLDDLADMVLSDPDAVVATLVALIEENSALKARVKSLRGLLRLN